MNFYVSASVSNATKANAVAQHMRLLGHSCTYRWFDLPDPIPSNEASGIASEMLRAVVSSDLLILILPGGRGAHVELGAALSHGIEALICYEQTPTPSLFYQHPMVTQLLTDNPYDIALAAELLLLICTTER